MSVSVGWVSGRGGTDEVLGREQEGRTLREETGPV